tara:strand:+ start:82 stop:222 length:141 start_codon:yes stop_codon:yes gene_type:complete
MKEIDEMLEKWIHSSIIRKQLKKLIIKYARHAFEDGQGIDGYGRYE